MSRFNIPLVAECLTAYAIERQNGWERSQPKGAPPWQEQRRLWTDAILQGMARLERQTPDPKLMEQFDHDLEQAGGSAATVSASPQLQRATIQNLRCFVTALEDTGDDRRRQVNMVREVMEDMASHLPWAGGNNGLDFARDEAERSLARMTARMPIRFTRVLLGGDAGPHWATGFVSGCVEDADAVRQTPVYQGAIRDYPEIADWPALCTVYVGRGLPSVMETVDASAFDLEIMNRIGDRFLDERGICWVGGPYQMTIATTPKMNAPAGMQTEEPVLLLQGSRSMIPDDFAVYERFAVGDNCVTFCLDLLADEETIFGRQLSSEQDGSYAVLYAVYDEATGQVRDTLDIELRLPRDEKWFQCKLSPDVTDSLKQKMDAFCVELYGEHLPEPLESDTMEAGHFMGPAMGGI